MIDNSIYDSMKQTWINLELYFERYEFSFFFKERFGFFLNFSEFFMNFLGFFEFF